MRTVQFFLVKLVLEGYGRKVDDPLSLTASWAHPFGLYAGINNTPTYAPCLSQTMGFIGKTVRSGYLREQQMNRRQRAKLNGEFLAQGISPLGGCQKETYCG
jgi:hypothetical protein